MRRFIAGSGVVLLRISLLINGDSELYTLVEEIFDEHEFGMFTTNIVVYSDAD